MPIAINLDVMLARRKKSLTQLADEVGVTLGNLSILKTGKARAIRFSTLEALCRALDCQPGDLLEWTAGDSGAAGQPGGAQPDPADLSGGNS